jgi:hypothetical protein
MEAAIHISRGRILVALLFLPRSVCDRHHKKQLWNSQKRWHSQGLLWFEQILARSNLRFFVAYGLACRHAKSGHASADRWAEYSLRSARLDSAF